MATIIRRQAETGDARLPRIPFPEPGPAPFTRASALSHQSASGNRVAQLADAEGSWAPFNPANGAPPNYRIFASGVPSFEFDTVAGTNYVGSEALFRSETAGHPLPLSFLAVFTLLRDGNSAEAGSSRYAHLTRAGTAGIGSLAIRPVYGAENGEIVFAGNTGAQLVGPKVPVDGLLHFAAGVYDGANSRLHFDNTVVTGALNAYTSKNFFAGYSVGGHRFAIVEAAHYSVALTAAEVAAKRDHYRSLYQF